MEKNAAVVMIDPEKLKVVSNVRLSLKKFKVDYLADQILAMGGITTPLKVEPKGSDGLYPIISGHYRQAAALKLNKDGTGIKCPCIVEPAPADERERIKIQLSENQDRENMSPMDIAVAGKKLLDQGVPRIEIRQMFPRPGGAKGLAMQPLSNAALNMYISFLEFPKDIQTRVHEGRIGVAAAYKLTTKPKEHWEAILAQEEADRLAEIAAEDKQEEKFLADEKKAADQEAKAKQDQDALDKAAKIQAEKEAELKAKQEAAAEAYKLAKSIPSKEKEAKKKAEEHHKAAEADLKGAEKAHNDAVAAAEKLKAKVDANKKLAEERKAKLEEARQKALDKGPSPAGIDKAAAKVGGTGPVALSAGDIRKMIADNSLPGSYPKTQKIFQAFARACAGVTTSQQCLSEVAWIVGERKQKPVTIKEEKQESAKAPAA